MTKFKTVWFWDSGILLDSNIKHIMSFYDNKYPKPSVVADIKSPDHSACHSFNYINSDGHLSIAMVSDDFNSATNAWYVYIDGSSLMPPLMSVVAFIDKRFPNGTVIPFSNISKYGISLNESAGFIRWIDKESRIQQIYVDERHRRLRLSTRMIAVVDIMITSSTAWSGKFLNGGDITTDNGELLRQAWSNSTRVTNRVGSVE